ncbi:GNAT family N-acetyltransferase [Actinomadura kijaniata]|uniref:GNAT family N-acetyltransferase n=1 Tax=Actinomadura kijaniata TaxID=46161 RepID=UPI000835A3E2|nr:GNAT family N-acetyltransferase [Actinomadura kijaniata]
MTQLAEGNGARIGDGGWAATLDDVRIRPYNVTDDARLRRMSAWLSRGSLYTRFFSGTPAIPEPYVRSLDGLDHWNREALAALLDDDLIGIAEYFRDRGRPWRAEIAMLVVDPWQRRGLGGLLLDCLSALALRRGITEFDAEVVFDNQGVIRAIRRRWPDVRSLKAEGSAHFRLPVAPPGPVRSGHAEGRHPG